MIGKSLSERHARAILPDDRAVALLEAALESHARELVRVRAQDARMVACVFAHASEAEVKICRGLGFELTLGKTGVLGLLGADAVHVFPHLPPHFRAWLEVPCGARETKVLLVSGGVALLSIEANAGNVTVRALSRRG